MKTLPPAVEQELAELTPRQIKALVKLPPELLAMLGKFKPENLELLGYFSKLLEVPGFARSLKEQAEEHNSTPFIRVVAKLQKLVIWLLVTGLIVGSIFLVSGGTFSSVFNRVRAKTYDADPGSTIDQWGNPTNQALRGYAFSHADNHVAPPEWIMSVCEYESIGSIHMKASGLQQGDNGTSIDWGICQVNDYWHADKMDRAKSPNWQDNFEVGWEILDSCWSRYSTDYDRVWCYNGYGLNAAYPPRVVAKHKSKFWLQDEAPYRSGEQAQELNEADEILKALIAEFDTGEGSLSDLMFTIVNETEPAQTSPSATTGGFAYPVKSMTDCGYDFSSGHPAVDLCEGRSLAQFGVYPPFPVYAACAGTISGSAAHAFTLSCRDYPGISFWYLHIQTSTLPSNGASYEVGEEIAKADGTGGTSSSGIHLHFRANKNGVAVEPLGIIASGGGVVSQPQDAQEDVENFQKFIIDFGEWEWIEGFINDSINIYVDGEEVDPDDYDIDPNPETEAPEPDSEPAEEAPPAEEEEEEILTWPGNGAVRVTDASKESVIFSIPTGEAFIPVNVCEGEVSPQSNGDSHLAKLECDGHDIVLTYYWSGELSEEIEGGGHAERTTLFGHTTSLTIKATTKSGQQIDVRPFFMTAEEIQEMQP